MFIHITSFKACISRCIKKMAAALKDNGVVYTSLSMVVLKVNETAGILQILQLEILKISAQDSGTADRGLLDYR